MFDELEDKLNEVLALEDDNKEAKKLMRRMERKKEKFY